MASLQRISIAGYRGFQAEQSLELATIGADQPALTILVGPNGGGKSTILEAVEFLFRSGNSSLPEGDRNSRSDYKVRFAGCWDDGHEIELKSSVHDPSDVTITQGQLQRKNVYCIPLRRTLPHQVNVQAEVWQRHVSQRPRLSSRGDTSAALQDRIVGWNVNTAVVRCLEESFRVSFRPLNSGKNYRVRVNGTDHPPGGLGEGFVYLLHILDAFFDAPDNAMILIDEPEGALHPAWTRELFRLLCEFSKRVQIVYATHSPYMLDFSALTKGAVLARVVREGDGCKIYTLTPDAVTPFQNESDNLNNPHILGTEAKEAFFLSDRVILVEGQEDVVCYRRMAIQIGTKLEGEFFGWGSGGVEKMKSIARVLHELGFKKVVGILDAKQTDELQLLQKQFPQYYFRAIPTDDVRDKKNAEGKVSRGLCDTVGKMHPEHLQDVKVLLKWISDKLA